MDLGELGDFLSSKLEFTVDGRNYTVPPVTWEKYLELARMHEHAQAVAEGRAKVEDGPEDRPLVDIAPDVLGPVFEQLQKDGLHPSKIAIVARGAYLWQLGMDEVATIVLSGKIPAPETTSPTPTGSTGTAAASTTSRRGSTSGTTSRPKSKPPRSAQPA
jgi:hypothetical protein